MFMLLLFDYLITRANCLVKDRWDVHGYNEWLLKGRNDVLVYSLCMVSHSGDEEIPFSRHTFSLQLLISTTVKTVSETTA